MPATIAVTAWLDQNGNGIQDPGDGPVANVGVSITQPGGTVVTGTTVADGTAELTVSGSGSSNYQIIISYIAPGAYYIETPASGQQTVNVTDENSTIGVGVGLGSSSSSGSTGDAYQQYLAADDQAYSDYTNAVDAALSTLNAANDSADADLSSALSAAEADAETALAPLQSAADAVMDPASSAMSAALDSAYQTFSAAWDAAGDNLTALQQAVDAYNAAADAAWDQWAAAVDTATAAAQNGLPSIQAAIGAAAASAQQTWNTASDANLLAYNDTVQGAYAQYVAAEQGDWDSYLATQPTPIEPRELQPPAPPANTEQRVQSLLDQLKNINGGESWFKVTGNDEGTTIQIEGPEITVIDFKLLHGMGSVNLTPKYDIIPFPKPEERFFNLGVNVYPFKFSW